MFPAAIAFGLAATLHLTAAAAEPVDPAVAYANRTATGPQRYREGFLGRGDDRLHYVEAGRGPLVIFYHGFPSFWLAFLDQMEALKATHRVVAVDGPGAGRSARPADLAAYRVDRLAGQLDRLARHLAGEERFVLVGHDWGAALAFAYAQAHPGRLQGVVGMSAPSYNLFLTLARDDPDQRSRSGYMQIFRGLDAPALAAPALATRIFESSYAGLIGTSAVPAERAALFRAAVARPEAIAGGIAWYRANIPAFAEIDGSWSWPAADPRLCVPALLIWGTADQAFVSTMPERLQQQASQMEVVRLSGVGHWTSIEQPGRATAAIKAFLARVDRRVPPVPPAGEGCLPSARPRDIAR